MDVVDALLLQQIKDVDQRDENQIMSELAGETLKEYFYEIIRYDSHQKRDVRKVKLSWVGVREVARNRGNIIVDEPTISEMADHWRVVVKATDLVRNFTVFGGSHQPKKMWVNKVDEKTGEVTGKNLVDDDYAFEKALSKAQRNAFDKCIPADYCAKAIDRLLRAAGRPPLLGMGQKKAKDQPNQQSKEVPKARASEIKAKESWDAITKDMIPDYPHLEPIAWDLCKMQPKEMYQALGVSSRSDMTISAWDAFLQLKEAYGVVKG